MRSRAIAPRPRRSTRASWTEVGRNDRGSRDHAFKRHENSGAPKHSSFRRVAVFVSLDAVGPRANQREIREGTAASLES